MVEEEQEEMEKAGGREIKKFGLSEDGALNRLKWKGVK